MGFMDAVYDGFDWTYPLTLKVYTDLGTAYHFDKAKKKEEEGGIFYKLFNGRNYVPYCDLSSGVIYHNGKIEYEVYMPSDKELIPIDRRRVNINDLVLSLRKNLLANDQEAFEDNVKDIEKFARKPVFIDAIVPPGVRMGLAQQVRLEVNYFGKSWLEKYGNIILTAIFVLGTVAVVWLSLDFIQNAIPKMAAQMPAIINAYQQAANQVPKV